MAVAAGDDHVGAQIGGVGQQQIGGVAVARQSPEGRVDAESREAARNALAAVDDRLRQHRGVDGDDLDMFGEREQRRGVADRPRRGLAAVPRGDDAVEAGRRALDAGHDDHRATALGENGAGEVVEPGRPARLDLLDDHEIETAREGGSVHRLDGVRIVVIERLRLDAGGARLRGEAFERGARPGVAPFAIAAHRRMARLERTVGEQRQIAPRPQGGEARFDALGEGYGVRDSRPVGFLKDDENVFEHDPPRRSRVYPTSPIFPSACRQTLIQSNRISARGDRLRGARAA